MQKKKITDHVILKMAETTLRNHISPIGKLDISHLFSNFLCAINRLFES